MFYFIVAQIFGTLALTILIISLQKTAKQNYYFTKVFRVYYMLYNICF